MFQVILLCVFGACAIAGTLIFALAVGRGNSSSIGQVVIWGTLDEKIFVDTLRTLQDGNSNLLGVSYVYKDPDHLMTDFTNALASGKGPDMILLRQDQVISQESRLIPITAQKMSAQEFTATFADAASVFQTPDGTFGIPFMIDPLVLYWNRDMVNSAGYADAPEYWDEVQDMAQRITQRTETGTITKATIPFGLFRNVNNAKRILSMLVMQAGGQVTARDSEGVLQAELAPQDSAVAQASLAALRFYTEFADPSKPGYSWNASLPEARKAFIAGDLALYLGLASEQPYISSANPNLNFSMASSTQRRTAANKLIAGDVYAFAFPRTAKNANGALAVAYLLVAPDSAALFSRAFNVPSATRAALKQKYGTQLDFLDTQASIVRSWTDPDPGKTDEIFRAMIEDTVSGSLLLGEAVQRADRQIATLLDEYNQEKNAQNIQ